MKAIVTNVKRRSAYFQYNGLTFDVVEVLQKIVALNLNGRTVDFSHNEVVIVDIENEYQKAYDDYNWGSDVRTYSNLTSYLITNIIKPKTPEYNCPS